MYQIKLVTSRAGKLFRQIEIKDCNMKYVVNGERRSV